MTPETQALIEAAEAILTMTPVYSREVALFSKLRAAIASAKAAEEGGKWIDVKHELPPMGKLVIVSMGNIVQSCLYSWNEIDQCWSPFDGDFDCAPLNTFTHWQPLPAPPVEAREKEGL